ncbi:S-adenosylmethionine-dependent methyltransferase [Recurvomyces mirabilis]|nr:S-adenosylmethionine-dependent methyltransferase [Recurvomyces mirabilis]
MLPTPSTSHVNYDQIYEPAEDSYLLLDTLSSASESTLLQTRFPLATPSPLVLEVGVGSGVVLAFVTANAKHIFGRSDILAVGTDANEYACRAAGQTVRGAVTEHTRSGKPAGIFGDCVAGDLAISLRQQNVDVLIFNPPYVPTETLPSLSTATRDKFEQDSHLLSLSYAGGHDGMETTNRLLADLPTVLSERGVAPEAVIAGILARPGGWKAEVVGSSGKTGGWEKLCVMRIWRP